MKKLIILAMAFGLIAQNNPVNAANITSVYNTETNISDENNTEKVKYQVNENEFFYYGDDSLDLAKVETNTTNALYGIAYYQKTVYVNSAEQYFHDSIEYEEFNDEYGIWYSGTLYLGDIKKTSNGWRAKYTGNLYIRG